MAEWHRMLGAETSKSAGRALLDYIIGKWPETVILLFGAGGMTYLASITGWLNTWGPIAWGGVGLASVLVLSAAFALYGYGLNRKRISDYIRTKLSTHPINVLAPIHQDERIDFSQFYHPYFQVTENVKFSNCSPPVWVSQGT